MPSMPSEQYAVLQICKLRNVEPIHVAAAWCRLIGNQVIRIAANGVTSVDADSSELASMLRSLTGNPELPDPVRLADSILMAAKVEADMMKLNARDENEHREWEAKVAEAMKGIAVWMQHWMNFRDQNEVALDLLKNPRQRPPS